MEVTEIEIEIYILALRDRRGFFFFFSQDLEGGLAHGALVGGGIDTPCGGGG